MAVLANRAAVATATTGTGTVTLGAALSNAFCTFAEAGVANGASVTYMLTEGSNFEIGRGTYTTTGTTLSRDTVLLSKISGTAGTAKMTLAGAAEVRIIAAAEDITAKALSSWNLIAASAVAVSHTGDLLQTTLATITVPANSMGPNGILKLTTLWSFGGVDADAKQARIYFGGVEVQRYTTTTTVVGAQLLRIIRNRNSASSQVMSSLTEDAEYRLKTTANQTTAINTAANVTILICGQLYTTATNTVTLEAYMAEVLYRD